MIRGNTIKTKLLILIAQLVVIVGFAQTFSVDGFNYNVISTNPNEVEVTGGTDGSSPLTIRSTVTDNGITYTVTAIGNSAYRNSTSNVVLPNTITTIKFRAFRDNGGLTSITLPASVISVQGEAFFNSGLTEVIAEGTVPASISNSSFGTRSNVNLLIPDGFEEAYVNAGWTGFATINGELPIGAILVDGNIRYRIASKTPNTLEVIGLENTLQDIVIPNLVTESTFGENYTVTRIGFRAFRNAALQSVQLPANLEIIAAEAFENNNLTTITFPVTLTEIGATAFKSNPLTSVISQAIAAPTLVDNSIENRGDISLTVPSGSEAAYVTNGWTGFFSINGTPFIGSSFSLDGFNYTINGVSPNTVQLNGGTTTPDLVLPTSITKNTITFTITAIGEDAFRIKNLTSVILPSSLETIGVQAFQSNNLTTITFPSTLTNINARAFRGNPLTSVISQAIAAPTLVASSIENRGDIFLTVPNGSEAAYVANGWTGFFSINGTPFIGSSFTVDGFNYTTNGVNPNTVEITGGGTGILDLVLPSTTSKNGISFTVTAIGEDAFRNRALNSIILPDNVEVIGVQAFQSNNLTTITFPATVTLIDVNAFSNNSLTQVIFAPGLETIGRSAFQSNSLATVTLPTTVETIDTNAFRLNQLTGVTLPAGLTTLGAAAFRDNLLTSIVIPNGITELKSQTFRNNDLESVTLPNNLQIIENDVFRDNEITSIDFPASLTTLGGFSFRNNKLTSVTIPANISTIAASTFNENLLTTVTIPSNITSIEDAAFQGNPLANIIADSATPATITTSSFGTRSTINLTIIPNQQSVINDYVTAGWTGFGSVNGEFLVGARFTEGNLRYEVTSVNPNTVKVLNRVTTAQNIVIPLTITTSGVTFNVTAIENNAFQNTDVTSVAIGGNIVSIGNNAFQGSSLTSVNAQGTTPATIETNSFGENGNISLTIPIGSETDYENAGWIGFFSVNGSGPSVGNTFSVGEIRYEILTLSPNTVKAIGTSGNVPNGNYIFPEVLSKNNLDFIITTIGNSAFRDKGVTTLSLPSTLTTIEFRGFRDNGSLTSLTIPANVTSIGNEAFFDNGLTEIISEVISPFSVNNATFGNRTRADLFIPAGTRQAYINAGWTDFKSIIEQGTLVLEAKVFLQGAFQNPNSGEETLMRDDLRFANLIPTVSPYSDGATCDSNVFTITGNDAIVDWVFVELRDATNNTTIVEGKSALLQRDGDVVDTNGAGVLQFASPLGNYFVTIKHRNHLSIITANAVSLTGMRNTLNFTNATNQITFGSNAQTTAAMPVNTLGMWAGNVNGDTIVQYSGTNPDVPAILSLVLNDVGNFLNFSTFIVNGYNTNDVNMDGKVQYEGVLPDAPFILQNVLAHPGNFLKFSTFQIQEQLPEN